MKLTLQRILMAHGRLQRKVHEGESKNETHKQKRLYDSRTGHCHCRDCHPRRRPDPEPVAAGGKGE